MKYLLYGMTAIPFKSLILLFILLITTRYVGATDVPGYIINENTDTVHGTIRLGNINPVTGGLFLKGFDMESLHYQVSFKGKEDKTFQTFLPTIVLGFGFTYHSTAYQYIRFLLENTNIFTKKREKYRFLSLEYRGKIDLYKNVKYWYNPPNNTTYEKFIPYYEYFLYNNTKGLLKVAMDREIHTVRDLLQQYDVDEKFIQEIPEKTNFKDIRWVLERYDGWLSRTKRNI